ncbi:hypothetical protein ORI90_09715, partial [Bifidobacterium longum]|nr:hypothetical protein [Bifidobacterium longum]
MQRLVIAVHAQAGHHAPLGRELDGVLQVEGRVALALEGIGIGRGHGLRAAVDGVVDIDGIGIGRRGVGAQHHRIHVEAKALQTQQQLVFDGARFHRALQLGLHGDIVGLVVAETPLARQVAIGQQRMGFG